MHSDIDAAGLECVFDLQREKSFAAEIGEGTIDDGVAGRLDRNDLDGIVGPTMRLPQE